MPVANATQGGEQLLKKRPVPPNIQDDVEILFSNQTTKGRVSEELRNRSFSLPCARKVLMKNMNQEVGFQDTCRIGNHRTL